MTLKRSKQIMLVAFAGVFAVAGCDQRDSDNSGWAQAQTEQAEANNPNEIGTMFSDEPGQPKCEDTYTTEECRDYRLVATNDHKRDAPKYGFQSECEANHGTCESIKMSDGSNIFMPAMAGFAVGAATGIAAAALANSGRAPTPLYRGRPKDCDPNKDQNCDNTSRSGGARSFFYTGRGSYVGAGSSGRIIATPSSSVGRGSFSSGSRGGIGAVSRGGFGASAGGHAGGGS